MYTYSIVERALAKAFSIDPASMGAFRGRIQHFRKLGMVPSSPGRGRKISYERDHVYKWALGLEFAEFGMDPILIKFFIDNFAWMRAREHLLDDKALDKSLVFYPNMLSLFGQYEVKPFIGGVVCVVVNELAELDAKRKESPHELTYELLGNRLGVINLGHLRRSVENGLKSVQK
jgi:hypothetical protein